MHPILVIEDELSVLDNITQVLEFENYQVLRASEGQTGVQLARENLGRLLGTQFTAVLDPPHCEWNAGSPGCDLLDRLATGFRQWSLRIGVLGHCLAVLD